MATYKKIQAKIKERYGYVAKTCWIAHVKSDHGLITRKAPNRESENTRKHPCPPEKRADIEDVMRSFGMIN